MLETRQLCQHFPLITAAFGNHLLYCDRSLLRRVRASLSMYCKVHAFILSPACGQTSRVTRCMHACMCPVLEMSREVLTATSHQVNSSHSDFCDMHVEPVTARYSTLMLCCQHMFVQPFFPCLSSRCTPNSSDWEPQT
jgi:hypothetical protein